MRKLLSWVFAVTLVTQSTAEIEKAWNLVWEDDFDRLDFNKWQHEITAWGGGNYEFQAYTNLKQNSYVRDGTLFIKPTLTADRYGENIFQDGSMNMFDYGFCSHEGNWGCYRHGPDVPPIMSARLRSYQRFSFKFGKVVIQAKMPAGDWLWPAMWLLPEDWVYGGWPMSGEIDIVEIIGNRDFRRGDQWLGVQHAGAALHWGPRWDMSLWWLTVGSQFNEDKNYADHFFTYEMEWTETRMIIRIDGMDVLKVPSDEEYENWQGFYEFGNRHVDWKNLSNPWEGATNMAPFDKAFHLILNVAVGGTLGFIPDDGCNGGGDCSGTGPRGNRPKPWTNDMTQRDAQVAFWADRNNWYPTWQGEDAALQVKNIRVYEWGEKVEEPEQPEEPEEPEEPPEAGHSTSVQVSIVLTVMGLVCALMK